MQEAVEGSGIVAHVQVIGLPQVALINEGALHSDSFIKSLVAISGPAAGVNVTERSAPNLQVCLCDEVGE